MVRTTTVWILDVFPGKLFDLFHWICLDYGEENVCVRQTCANPVSPTNNRSLAWHRPRLSKILPMIPVP